MNWMLFLAWIEASQAARVAEWESFFLWGGPHPRNRLAWVVEFDRTITKSHRSRFHLEPRA